MTALQIGTVVVRDSDNARYRLTGTYGRSWLADRLDVFEAPARLTPRTLANFRIEADDAPIAGAGGTPEAGSEDAGKLGLLRQNHERARAESPGWSALRDAHEHRMRAIARANADEQAQAERLDDLHAFVGDEA